MKVRLVIIILLAGLFVVFMFQNDDPLRVRFILWSAVISKSLLILLAFITGLVFGWISLAWGRRKSDSAREKKRRGR